MSRASQRHQQVAAKVQADAMAKVATVALVKGHTVLSCHADFKEANIALCAAFDVFYGDPANVDIHHHGFDLVPLSVIPKVGGSYDPLTKVWVP